MKKLIILDTFTQNVIEVSVSEDAYKVFVEEYDKNTECWVWDTGLEDKLKIHMDDCSYMWAKDDYELIKVSV